MMKRWFEIAGGLALAAFCLVFAAPVEGMAFLIPRPPEIRNAAQCFLRPEAEPPGEDTAAFVSRLYRTCLGREADAGGLFFWQARLESGEAAGADVAAGFFLSREYQDMDQEDGQYVDDLYRAVLGREPDRGGKEFWLDYMDAGSSRHLVLSGFTNSQEFRSLCSRYRVDPGSYTSPEIRDQNREVTAFVQRMYRLVLRRDGEAEGLNNWTSFLLEQGGTGSEAAEGFFLSEEFRRRKTDLDDYVELLYRALLGRNSDPEGKRDWIEAVRSGRMTPAELIGSFAGSEEFRRLCQKYGVSAGSRSRPGGDLPNVRIFQPESVPEMRTLVNQLRENKGLPPFASSDQMEALALRRAEEISRNYSHEGHQGGENLAYSSSKSAGAEKIFQGWVNSSEHLENLTAKGYRTMGCAKYVTERGSYWVLVLGN